MIGSSAPEKPLLRVEDPPQTLVEHLTELRTRLIWSLLAVGAASVAVYPWSGALLSRLARPAGTLFFNAPADAFLTRLRVAVFAGFALALPVVLAQVWLFTARAMEPRWRSAVGRLLPLSYVLFLCGAGLAFFVVAPAAVRFLIAFGSDDIRPLLSLGAYVSFVTDLMLSFGAVFQLPLVLVGLNRAGLVSRKFLSERRRLAWFLAVVGAAVLTPGPDVVSQAALALPAGALFELTLLSLA